MEPLGHGLVWPKKDVIRNYPDSKLEHAGTIKIYFGHLGLGLENLMNLPMNFPSHRENEALERASSVRPVVQGDYSVVHLSRDSPLGDCPIGSK